MTRSRVGGVGVLLLGTLVVAIAFSSAQPANADGAENFAQCTAVGDLLIDCGAYGERDYTKLYPGNGVFVHYDSGFCKARIEQKNFDGSSTIEVSIINGIGDGCPYQHLERVTYTVEPFFVLPESPIGAIAMVTGSIAALGGFLYFRTARKPLA
jgi:hypothetical protein